MEGKGPSPVSMAVSVPKRLFKKAVDRNLLKRRIREAYRLNKMDLYALLQQKERKLNLVIQYRHQQILSFHLIQEALKKGLTKLAETLDSSD
jgi:ribonuclease P protein component